MKPALPAQPRKVVPKSTPSAPMAKPVVAEDGTLYGSTAGTVAVGSYPGVLGMDTVFSLTPSSVRRLDV